jgi:hypothetical protein
MNTQNGTGCLINEAENYIEANIALQYLMTKENKSCAVLMLLGSPGIGKTQVMSEFCEKHGYGLIVHHMAIMLLEMLTGLPRPGHQEGTIEWSKPEILNFDKLLIPSKNSKIILFLDDIHLCTKEIQKYLFRLIDSNNRGIHGYSLPDNVAIVMAGNQDTDKAGFQQILAPVSNRIYFQKVHSDAKCWINNFAIKNGIRIDIISFIDQHTDMISSDPLESKAWASPRSWTNCSKQIDMLQKIRQKDELDVIDLLNVCSGIIGEEFAKSFVEYVKVLSKWNAVDILAGKKEIVYKDLSKSSCYCLLVACINEFIKHIRLNKYNVAKITNFRNELVDVFHSIHPISAEVVPIGISILLKTEMVENNKSTPISLSILELMDSDMKTKVYKCLN